MTREALNPWTVPERTVLLTGAPVTVRRLATSQFMALAFIVEGKSLDAIVEMFVRQGGGDGAGDPLQPSEAPRSGFLHLLATDGPWILSAIAVAAKVDEQVLGDSGPDEVIELCSALVELNVDFFTQRLYPLMSRVADQLTQRLTNGAGSIPSSS